MNIFVIPFLERQFFPFQGKSLCPYFLKLRCQYNSHCLIYHSFRKVLLFHPFIYQIL